jgi:hypothetical protein
MTRDINIKKERRRGVSLRRAGVRSEKIHGKRVTQVKPHHRKDTQDGIFIARLMA